VLLLHIRLWEGLIEMEILHTLLQNKNFCFDFTKTKNVFRIMNRRVVDQSYLQLLQELL